MPCGSGSSKRCRGLLRAAWALLPLTLGPTLADRLHDWENAIRTAASAMLWIGWAAVAVASCVALPACLAVVASRGRPRRSSSVVPRERSRRARRRRRRRRGRRDPRAAEWFLNGPAYANERRYPLGMPGPTSCWAAVVGGGGRRWSARRRPSCCSPAVSTSRARSWPSSAAAPRRGRRPGALRPDAALGGVRSGRNGAARPDDA